MHARTLVLCVAATACAAAVVGQVVPACVFDFGGDCANTLTCTGSGTPASSSSESATTSSGTAGAGGSGCKSAAECPGPTDFALLDGGVCPAKATCKAGTCGLVYEADAGATDQPSGTCTQRVCQADGTVVTVEDDTNGYDAGAPCVVAQCTDAGLTVTAQPDGTQCPPPSAKSIQGRCVAGVCMQCMMALQDCTAGLDCTASHYCVLGHCVDGSKDGSETDTDCGGPDCAPCGDGKVCGSYKDCASGVCKIVPPAMVLTCQAPTCFDQTQNGGETDKDCGGGATSGCPPCAAGLSCFVAADCASQVCTGGICQDATCSDGVQNGSEQGVDCGADAGSCTEPCPTL